MRILSIAFVLTVFIVWLLLQSSEEVQGTVRTYTPPTFTASASTTLPYQVSGKIEAGDSVTIRAQTNGLIHRVLVREGDTVYKNQLLVQQSTPVLNTQIALQEAQNRLSILAQDAQTALSTDSAKRTSVSSDTTVENTVLTYSSNAERVQDLSSLLVIGLEEATLNLVTTLEFVDSHKSNFTAQGLEDYRSIVVSLYNSQVSFLAGGITYPIQSEDDILNVLSKIKEQDMYDVEGLLTLSTLVDKQFTLLQSLMGSAEDSFFDDREVSSSENIYSEYLSHRALAVSSQRSLRSLINSLKSADDTLSITNNTNDTDSTLALLDKEIARTQADYATKIAEQNSTVAGSQLSVLYAQQSLAHISAPFSGVISEVFVETGEYVSPGTPLFTLTGTDSYELLVHVPSEMLPLLHTGAPFIVYNNVKGYVSRFAGVVIQGSIEVYIELIDSELLLGDVLVGEIQLTSTTLNIQEIPKNYVHFSSLGAYVKDTEGNEVLITILYDIGDSVFVKAEQELRNPLTQSLSISL